MKTDTTRCRADESGGHEEPEAAAAAARIDRIGRLAGCALALNLAWTLIDLLRPAGVGGTLLLVATCIALVWMAWNVNASARLRRRSPARSMKAADALTGLLHGVAFGVVAFGVVAGRVGDTVCVVIVWLGFSLLTHQTARVSRWVRRPDG